MIEIRSEIERLWGVKSLGQSRSASNIFRQKAAWITSENVDGRAEKPRYGAPQGVGVEIRYEAELDLSASRIRVKNLGAFCCTARWRGIVEVYRFLSPDQKKAFLQTHDDNESLKVCYI